MRKFETDWIRKNSKFLSHSSSPKVSFVCSSLHGEASDMTPLALHGFHERLNATFIGVNGMEVVEQYGDWLAEYTALRNGAGVLDLSFRSRLVLTGADRVRLLNGQVTNNVKDLAVHEGCYAALVTNKGRMQSDLNIYILTDELLLDFEPGLSDRIAERFDK